jgi:polyribonucleotide nucleotidyltransferase
MKEEGRRMILEDESVLMTASSLRFARLCVRWIFFHAYGSAMLFKRGAHKPHNYSLGSPAMGQIVDGAEGEEEHHYIHHYMMPPYASGETGHLELQSDVRSDMAHSQSEPCSPMILTKDFPYTIRVVSEIMSSTGSTSQALSAEVRCR